jgi:putative N-acetylmannosamine-6-phosphate epimerase
MKLDGESHSTQLHGAALLNQVRGGLIVSCQARDENPLAAPVFMAAMARAAQLGGALGIRASGAENIRAIRARVELPIIGIDKVWSQDSDVYITPTFCTAQPIAESGADIIAIDGTPRHRPGGETLADLIDGIHNQLGKPVMADVSTWQEGVAAAQLGADVVATTLSGYTSYSRQAQGPDLEMLQQLLGRVDVPVIVEGKIWYPEDARRALELGAWAVVVGTAITNPMEITRRFATITRGEIYRGPLPRP